MGWQTDRNDYYVCSWRIPFVYCYYFDSVGIYCCVFVCWQYSIDYYDDKSDYIIIEKFWTKITITTVGLCFSIWWLSRRWVLNMYLFSLYKIKTVFRKWNTYCFFVQYGVCWSSWTTWIPHDVYAIFQVIILIFLIFIWFYKDLLNIILLCAETLLNFNKYQL